ncbi:peptide chain release factor N(5)-glutamine methyltransferase [Candidatus Peregrinibacteria bacterium]|nr:peptide chain release factor N(5)-glutamine methyltransferase [Candidatus Peregrinibacteria bacterium]
MTLDEACKSSGIDRLEAEVLLADLLGKDRTWLLAHGSEDIGTHADQALQRFRDRKTGMPVAYITGKKEFCGRMFAVSPGILIPRESTENLLNLAWDVLHGSTGDCIRTLDDGIAGVVRIFRPQLQPELLVDVGTGSGCIGITLSLETSMPVIATDSSMDAVAAAKQNAVRLGAEITVEHGDCLNPLREIRKPFLVVSNPPYIPEGTVLSSEVVDFEPRSALFSGEDGSEVLRKILQQAEEHPCCVGVVLECGEKQAALCFPSAQTSTL